MCMCMIWIGVKPLSEILWNLFYVLICASNQLYNITTFKKLCNQAINSISILMLLSWGLYRIRSKSLGSRFIADFTGLTCLTLNAVIVFVYCIFFSCLSINTLYAVWLNQCYHWYQLWIIQLQQILSKFLLVLSCFTEASNRLYLFCALVTPFRALSPRHTLMSFKLYCTTALLIALSSYTKNLACFLPLACSLLFLVFHFFFHFLWMWDWHLLVGLIVVIRQLSQPSKGFNSYKSFSLYK